MVYMWGYLPGASLEKSPILSPVPVPLSDPAFAGDLWKDVCGGGCGFAIAISGRLLSPLTLLWLSSYWNVKPRWRYSRSEIVRRRSSDCFIFLVPNHLLKFGELFFVFSLLWNFVNFFADLWICREREAHNVGFFGWWKPELLDFWEAWGNAISVLMWGWVLVWICSWNWFCNLFWMHVLSEGDSRAFSASHRDSSGEGCCWLGSLCYSHWWCFLSDLDLVVVFWDDSVLAGF